MCFRMIILQKINKQKTFSKQIVIQLVKVIINKIIINLVKKFRPHKVTIEIIIILISNFVQEARELLVNNFQFLIEKDKESKILIK